MHIGSSLHSVHGFNLVCTKFFLRVHDTFGFTIVIFGCASFLRHAEKNIYYIFQGIRFNIKAKNEQILHGVILKKLFVCCSKTFF